MSNVNYMINNGLNNNAFKNNRQVWTPELENLDILSEELCDLPLSETAIRLPSPNHVSQHLLAFLYQMFRLFLPESSLNASISNSSWRLAPLMSACASDLPILMRHASRR